MLVLKREALHQALVYIRECGLRNLQGGEMEKRAKLKGSAA
jgi:hypothetical protein